MVVAQLRATLSCYFCSYERYHTVRLPIVTAQLYSTYDQPCNNFDIGGDNVFRTDIVTPLYTIYRRGDSCILILCVMEVSHLVADLSLAFWAKPTSGYTV